MTKLTSKTNQNYKLSSSEKDIAKDFFLEDTISIAKKLIGCLIVKETDKGTLTGRIVETEAYLEDDEASHSYKGETKRNSAMYDKAGTSYVYISYGIHNCFNIVTNNRDKGEAVLIRAVEPITGIETMCNNRAKNNVLDLCSGPGKFTQAFGVDLTHNYINLLDKNSSLKLEILPEKFDIVSTTRVGISKAQNKPYRFYLKDNKFISKK